MKKLAVPVLAFFILVGLSGCATPSRTESGSATTSGEAGTALAQLDVVEQPELEPEWADWVKQYYPNWRKHYWVDRGQWGNRGYLVGGRPRTDTPPVAETTITPLPAAGELPAPAIVETPPPTVTPPPDRPTTYVVKKGDSLWRIAGKIYKNPLKWPRIYRANQDKIKNPHRIYPGQVLTIPWD
ncbi:MAG: LysM peptidoglycan-binding domain-containing protein [Verrucomicrobiae bacterium]|nr:LysM peptidoglycan-binding domain-containing protein [Verrucomicrobiae bacterium]MDW8342904.1 LysM peptidoglycan-binding domain-containing protein [Verrucomicrobiae bacterium]